MKIEDIKEGFDHLRDSVAEGWQRLRHSASSALTRFTSGEVSSLPARSEVDDEYYWPGNSWSMLEGDVFEDDTRFVVRIELPGMEKDDLTIDVQDDTLYIRGEKRFERETTEGRWRVLQCAYGNFRRTVPLPGPVLADKAEANYRNGVLKIELPKAAPSRPGARTIKVT